MILEKLVTENGDEFFCSPGEYEYLTCRNNVNTSGEETKRNERDVIVQLHRSMRRMFGHAKQPYLILPGCPRKIMFPRPLPVLVVLKQNTYHHQDWICAETAMRLKEKVKNAIPN